MNVEQTLAHFCKQVAVYWGNPVTGGSGGFTFDSPVEIKCRWEDRTDVVAASNGKEYVSSARVFLLQDVAEEGWLFLGELSDVDRDYLDNPKKVDRAYKIIRFDKLPAIEPPTEYVRVAYL